MVYTTLQHTAGYTQPFSTQQGINNPSGYTALQHTAGYSTLQHSSWGTHNLQHTTKCTALQHTAGHTTLQHTAGYKQPFSTQLAGYTTLQLIAGHTINPSMHSRVLKTPPAHSSWGSQTSSAHREVLEHLHAPRSRVL